MKTAAVLVIAFVLIAGVTVQSQAQIGFAVGLRTGLNFGSIGFDPEMYANFAGVTKGGRTGFMIGGVAEMSFGHMFAVEISPTYVGKGASFEQGQVKETISISELDFPILFKVRFLPGRFRPYGFAGPNLGIILSAKDSFEGLQGVGTNETDLKNNPRGYEVSSMDFSLDFGGGMEFLVMKNLGITGDVRYSLGLSNIVGKGALVGAGAIEPSWKTHGFQIMFGALYHI